MQDITLPIISVAVLVFSAVFHEIAHGLTAWYLGDPTAKNLGRLSLNPFAHLEWLGSVILPTMLVLSHSPFVFGWAKPVPVNLQNIKKPYGHALVAMAGPMSNILLACIAALIMRYLNIESYMSTAQFLIIIVTINCTLAVFNMIPLPPLDGYYLVEYLVRIPRRISDFLLRYSFVGILVAVVVFQNLFQHIVISLVTMLTGYR